jgi:hypothetical protein
MRSLYGLLYLGFIYITSKTKYDTLVGLKII